MHREAYFFEAVANAIMGLARLEAFKQLPGHEGQYAPHSEYLFKTLQPRLDDILFVGRNYESAFDEFEILFALVVADNRKQKNENFWAPIGRFGWKHHRGESPLARILGIAQNEGEKWRPLRSGLFGGDLKRFLEVADKFEALITRLGWF